MAALAEGDEDGRWAVAREAARALARQLRARGLEVKVGALSEWDDDYVDVERMLVNGRHRLLLKLWLE
jgi:hypothetical protein